MIQNEPGLNSHVEKYLDYYCDLPHPPGFAILLKGQWGCGKTWFIKNYYKKKKALLNGNMISQDFERSLKASMKHFISRFSNAKKSTEEEYKFLYVSLYGMTSFSEIELAFFQQSYPIFTAEQLQLTTNFFNLTLKAPSAVNLTDNLIKLVNKNVSKKILIFDDLERCKIDINNILGYINSFIEHKDSKVIIIANEEKLENLGGSDYKSIKEKLIGKTFGVSTDFEGVLNDFIDKVKNPYAKKFLFDNINLIRDLYQQEEYENLRSLNLIILDFEMIFKDLPEKVIDKPEALQEILKTLVIFSIEVKRRMILPKDIRSLKEEQISKVIEQTLGYQSKSAASSKNKIISLGENERYLSLNFYDIFPSESWWQSFFSKGFIDKDELEKSILSSKYFYNEDTPNWVELFHFDELSDDAFDSLIEKIEIEYKNREHEEIGVIKHIHGLLLIFSDAEIYCKNKEEILNDSKLYIDDLKNSDRLSLTSYNKERYSSLLFYGQEFEEFKALCSYINYMQELVREEMLPTFGQNLLSTMQKNSYEFYRMICVPTDQDEYSSSQKYYDIPIFKSSYISPNIFVENLLYLNSEAQRCIFSALKKRYEFGTFNEKLVEELIWLKSVQALLQMEFDKRKGKLSGYKLMRLIEEYLNGSIEKLELKQLQMQSN